MITGAIFDVDGTLLDSMGFWMEAGERYLKEKGKTPEAGLGKTLYPMSMSAGAQYLKTHYGLEESTEEIIRGVNGVIRNFFACEVQLKPGAAEFLRQMQSHGIPMRAATATDKSILVPAFHRLKIGKYITEIFTCSEVGAGKDRPDVYHAARRSMGTDTESTWVFEDALHAAKTAAEAGFPTAGVYDKSGELNLEKLKSQVTIYLGETYDFQTFYEKAKE